MTKQITRKPRLLVLVALLCTIGPSGTISARDQDFHRLVDDLESHFHLKRNRIPLFGFAKPLVRFGRPSGGKVLDVAIFEDQDFSETDEQLFKEAIDRALGREWHPLVRVVSRPGKEQTVIYARESGNKYKLIIATLESSEAVLVQLTMNSDDLVRLIEDRAAMGEGGRAFLNDSGDE